MDPCMRKPTYPAKVAAPVRKTSILMEALQGVIVSSLHGSTAACDAVPGPSSIVPDISYSPTQQLPSLESPPSPPSVCPSPPTRPLTPPQTTPEEFVQPALSPPRSPIATLLTPLLIPTLISLLSSSSSSGPDSPPIPKKNPTARRLNFDQPSTSSAPPLHSKKFLTLQKERKKCFGPRPLCKYIFKRGPRKGEECGKPSMLNAVKCKLHSTAISSSLSHPPTQYKRIRPNRLHIMQKYYFVRELEFNKVIVRCNGEHFIVHLPFAKVNPTNPSPKDYLIRMPGTFDPIWQKDP